MSIYKKLFDAKKEIGKISKDSKNPFFKSNYLSLNGLIDAIEEVLNKNGLLLLQPIIDNKVRSMIVDSEKDGSLETHYVISEMTLPNITDPQKLGSAITYFRRYTLESLLGLKADDDDGNLATKPKPVDVSPNSIERLKARLEACTTIDQLGKTYKSFTTSEQAATSSYTKELKEKLTDKKAA